MADKKDDGASKTLRVRMAEVIRELFDLHKDINFADKRRRSAWQSASHILVEYDIASARRLTAKQALDDKGSNFERLDDSTPVHPCRFCGTAAELWELRSPYGSVMKAVMCGNNGENETDEEPCPFYLPPNSYYHPTRREAFAYWNEKHAPR